MTYQLAQVNIAQLLEPLESPRLKDFVDNLDRINALAEAAPGFVWRLKGDGNDATSLRMYDNDQLIINLSVWESAQALKNYVYQSNHTAIMRRRREWFARMDVFMALWWIPAAHQPTPAEAEERLTHLRQHGPTAHAFTFQNLFPAPE